jgi:ribose transport system permease protein
MTRGSLKGAWFRRLQSLIALTVLVVVLSLASDKFLTRENTLNVLLQISINLCVSLGMTIVILSGGIDLSVGSVLALSGAVGAGLLKNGLPIPPFGLMLQFTVFGSVLAALAVGTTLGLFNGVVITRFRLPPFIATLGVLSIARGLTQLWTRGFPITGLGQVFGFIGTGRVLGIPMPVWISAALVGAVALLSRNTNFGRYVYAVGGNENAAKLSGVRVNRVKLGVYALGGGFAGVGGVLLASRLDSATPSAGIGDELNSIAAVVIGGASLSGGRGSVWGTVMGCLIIGLLNNGLVLWGVSPSWQLIIKGMIILAAVGLDRLGSAED